LYAGLGITQPSGNFGHDLVTHGVSAERFLIAFFQLLQPYAQLMSGLCAFFERRQLSGTGKAMRIRFDFDHTDTTGLEFDLNYFREAVMGFDKVKQLVRYFSLSHDSIWSLLKVFSDDYTVKPHNTAILAWDKAYREGAMVTATISLPESGFSALDAQLNRAFAIWQGFLAACADIELRPGDSFDFHGRMSTFRDAIAGEDLVNGWDGPTLVGAVSDYWPATFVKMLFWRLEQLEVLAAGDRAVDAAAFAYELGAFLDKHTIASEQEADLLRELSDLLNLPVWQRRYELYGAWVLALMDEVIAAYPGYKVHDDNGLISFAFKATRMASFDTVNGKVTLWAEKRMPAKALMGHGRKGNIQPDYTFFSGEEALPDPEKALAVVEVKQYRVPSAKNFGEALDDYAGNVPSAHIFLVNYGRLPGSLTPKFPARCTLFGQVQPKSSAAGDFLSALQAELPAARPPVLAGVRPDFQWPDHDWLLLYFGYQTIYVDISGSLDSPAYREFLRTVLKWSISGGSVQTLIAVDEEVRGTWQQPTAADVEALLALPFSGGTEFGNLLNPQNALVITDEDGLQIIRCLPWSNLPRVICYREGQVPSLLIGPDF
jgi:hypothetical protein